MRKLKPSGIEWIGDVPEGWKVERAKNMFKQRTSKGNETLVLLAATQRSGMIPQSLIEGVVQVAVGTDLQSFRTVRKNDFVISLRSFQGGFELSEYEGVCSPAYQVFHANRPIQTRFYKYMFKSDGFISKMNSLTVGIREGKNIQYKDFATALIPQPSLSEQHDIASYLDTKCAQLDELVANEQTQIEKLKQYRKSVITEAVTKGLAPTAPTKHSGVEWIGEIPEHWRIGKLKNICSFKTGSTPPTTRPDYFNGGVAWYTPSDFTESLILNDSQRTLSPLCLEDGVVKLFPAGVVLLVCIGATVGKVARTVKECYCNQQITALVPLKGYHAPFLTYWMYAIASYIKDTAMFTTLPIINNRMLSHQVCLIPPLTEQRAIAEYLDTKCAEIDALIAVKDAKIAKLGEYKKALIYECVTGKREVEATSDRH